MAKLYPPIIEGTIPAFWGDSITIPFSMNKVVNKTEIAGFSIKIKTVQNNLHLGTLKSSSFDLNECTATFSLTEEDILKFNPGQYYKVQMAYIDIYGVIGYYSTVGIIKRTTKPEISIKDLNKGERNQALGSYVGNYQVKDYVHPFQEKDKNGNLLFNEDGSKKYYTETADWTEKVASYRFKAWGLDGVIIADSGELLHMSANDESPDNSIDTFTMTQELTQNSTYYIEYWIRTTGGMELSQKYRLSPKQSVLPELSAQVLVDLNEENGYVNVSLLGDIRSDGYEKTANGAFLLTRRKLEEPGNWEELLRFGLRSEKPSTWSWKDFTVEQGVTYIYSVQQYSDKLYSQRIESKEIYVDFEHAFLFDGERQLKIKYNPKVSSFKTNILESKMETLGSKHPFIFRNGLVSYKEFPISGLISYLSDEENLFVENGNFSHENLIRKHDDSSIPRNNFKVRHTNLTNENIQRERAFKLNVLDWLNNGEPKLFRSPTEGNYIVRVMNNSLSPTDTVGRMLHTFQCNAYEIADCNYKNLKFYSFIRSDENSAEDRKVTQWATIETIKLLPVTIPANPTYTNNILPDGVHANELTVQGMLPGDKIRITYVDGNVLDIVIGATGSYAAANIAPISAIQLWQANAKMDSLITYSYETTYSNTFGLYSNAQSIEIPAKQIFGTEVVGRNVRTYLEDLKTSVLNVYYMFFEKRPIKIVYADAGSDVIVKDQNVDIDASKLYYDRYKTEPVVFDNLDVDTLYQIRLNALDKEADIEHNQDYYIDNNMNHFFPTPYLPKNLAYIDGKTKRIMAKEEYSTKIYIDPEIDETKDILTQLKELKGMDLNETGEYKIDDLRPKQLFIGSGIMMTIGYCVSFVTYNFEENERYLSKVKKDNYDNAVAIYSTAVKDFTGDYNRIESAIQNIEFCYNELLLQIEKDLAQYKEENGLGEDE